MYLRSTTQLVLQSALSYAGNHSVSLASLQQQISTGVRMHRPSDDPAAFRSVINQEFAVANYGAYLQNVTGARSQLNVAVDQLLAAKDIILEARDIAFESRQNDDRDIFVSQVERLISRMETLANEKFDGRYLFSGTASQTPPFVFGTAGDPGRASYVGADQSRWVSIGLNQSVAVSPPGRTVFQSMSRKATIIMGNTGAAPGRGASSATGFGELRIIHGVTTYAAGSGIQAGASSPGSDTIIGPSGSHRLAIDDVTKHISLNGGPSVHYTGSENDLLIIGPLGEKVHVDVQNVLTGFQGFVDISASGSLSTDGGATSQAIDFSDNQAIVHGSRGDVTFVDSTRIRRSGTAEIEFPGTADAFGVLDDLKRDLSNARELSPDAWQESLTRRIEDMERIQEHFLSVVGQMSLSLENLDAVQTHHEDLQLDTKRILSDLQSTDLPAAIAELQARQSLLQTTYAVSLGILNSSIIDFIR